MTHSLEIAGNRSPPGSKSHRGSISYRSILVSLLAVPLVAALGWYLLGPGHATQRADEPSAQEAVLYGRLLQATVLIAPDGTAKGGLGVLIDRDDRLVATVSPLVGDRTEIRVDFLTGRPRGTAQTAGGPDRIDERASGVGRIVSNDATRGLVLLRLDRLPEEASALDLGEWSSPPHRALHSLYSQDPDRLSQEPCPYSYRRGSIGLVVQMPHY